MIRLAFFFSALFLAAVMDMRTRTIPDWLVVLVALTSMLPPGQPNLLGVLAGLPLLLAGITIGGIGGGDVKLMGACGLVLGAGHALMGLFLALCLLVLWHAAGNMGRKKNRKKQKEETEQAYPLVPFLFAGMLIGIWIEGEKELLRLFVNLDVPGRRVYIRHMEVAVELTGIYEVYRDFIEWSCKELIRKNCIESRKKHICNCIMVTDSKDVNNIYLEEIGFQFKGELTKEVYVDAEYKDASVFVKTICL